MRLFVGTRVELPEYPHFLCSDGRSMCRNRTALVAPIVFRVAASQSCGAQVDCIEIVDICLLDASWRNHCCSRHSVVWCSDGQARESCLASAVVVYRGRRDRRIHCSPFSLPGMVPVLWNEAGGENGTCGMLVFIGRRKFGAEAGMSTCCNRNAGLASIVCAASCHAVQR